MTNIIFMEYMLTFVISNSFIREVFIKKKNNKKKKIFLYYLKKILFFASSMYIQYI